jgi:hypothetical protein
MILKWIFRVCRRLKEWNVDCVHVDRDSLVKTIQYLQIKQFPYNLNTLGRDIIKVVFGYMKFIK